MIYGPHCLIIQGFLTDARYGEAVWHHVEGVADKMRKGVRSSVRKLIKEIFAGSNCVFQTHGEVVAPSDAPADPP